MSSKSQALQVNEPKSEPRSMLDVESDRAIQQVQGAIVAAKKFPRSREAALKRILDACEQPLLIEQALYSYPRGDTTVTGPSIRLAEVIAQNWGNFEFGVVELSRDREESVMMSYAWDLETNVRQPKTFTVRHWRDRKNGQGYMVTDARDVYEVVANQAARRLRACILGVIPGDIVAAAEAKCTRLQADAAKAVPLKDRIAKMLTHFLESGISRETVEAKLGKPAEQATEAEVLQFGRVYQTIKDGLLRAEDFFGGRTEPEQPRGTGVDQLNAKFAAKNKVAEAPTTQAGGSFEEFNETRIPAATAAPAPVTEAPPVTPARPIAEIQRDIVAHAHKHRIEIRTVMDLGRLRFGIPLEQLSAAQLEDFLKVLVAESGVVK